MSASLCNVRSACPCPKGQLSPQWVLLTPPGSSWRTVGLAGPADSSSMCVPKLDSPGSLSCGLVCHTVLGQLQSRHRIKKKTQPRSSFFMDELEKEEDCPSSSFWRCIDRKSVEVPWNADGSPASSNYLLDSCLEKGIRWFLGLLLIFPLVP